MAVTSTTNKNLTLTMSIKVGEKVVKGLSATIDSETQNITLSNWINDMELYKANRVAIRAEEAKFEDMAFDEQEKLAGGSK
ncbi:hypothetical protein [Coprobacillus cateniformis]|uniref:hypothetical protein n=1 Tax=Coprobacillus cateniformis TaxID=100884 RepID=UPI00399EEC7A